MQYWENITCDIDIEGTGAGRAAAPSPYQAKFIAFHAPFRQFYLNGSIIFKQGKYWAFRIAKSLREPRPAPSLLPKRISISAVAAEEPYFQKFPL